ncbi:MAG: hypothetical protein KUG81_00900 [Gammaproteobacteria bacterium]|nr:hypothetical protein [Gammaproteobacteria bacterium]
MSYKTITLSLLYLILASPLLSAAPSSEDIQQEFLQALQEQVLIHDSAEALRNIRQIKQSLNTLQTTPTQQTLNQAQSHFAQFIVSWKAVETVYILGALDDNYLDHPRFIDYFHQAKESIPVQVEQALANTKPIEKVLFKYSTKSINALEYLLFAEPEKGSLLQAMDTRRIEAAKIAVDSIALWLGEIAQGYQSTDILLAENTASISQVVNALIDSSYKLANWRVGEAAGLSKKYAGKPSAQRLEYPFSNTSYRAIKSILQTHRKVIARDSTIDLLAIAQIHDAESEVLFIQKQIDRALEILTNMPRPLTKQIESPQFKALYKQLDKIHNAYYFILIDALNLNATIIDADGD